MITSLSILKSFFEGKTILKKERLQINIKLNMGAIWRNQIFNKFQPFKNQNYSYENKAI